MKIIIRPVFLFLVICILAVSPGLEKNSFASNPPAEYSSNINFGDIDGSGEIGLADIILLLRHISGTVDLEDKYDNEVLTRARLSSALGGPGVSDAVLLMQYYAGLIDVFPVEDLSVPGHKIKSLLPGTSLETKLYTYITGESGPTILVVGGVHGNEPAGYIAAGGIVNWTVDSGTLLVIPEANVYGVEHGTRRTGQNYDLNRAYPGDPNGTDAERIADAIYNVMLDFEAEWVLDLHESGNFYSIDPSRVGQTLISDYKSETILTSFTIVDRLNVNIPVEHHKFSVIVPPVTGSTAYVAGHEDYLDGHGITVETTTLLPMHDRVWQQLMVVNLMLDELDMRQPLSYSQITSQADDLVD